MTEIRFQAQRLIPAPPEALYSLLADYHVGHPGILPGAFTDFQVLEGGIGAGTRIRFTLKLGGRAQTTTGLVTEPEPGRRLVETYEDGTVTSFLIAPAPTGSTLQIETVWQARGGPAGWLERLLAPRMLGPLYEDELDRIEVWARGRGPAESDGT